MNEEKNEDLPGHIGQYAVEDILGSGGMSTIYRGVQPSLDRPVAIKVLPLHMAEDNELVDRFERESSIIAKMNHPHIIQIFDRGVDAGRYFIVMELVVGCSLDELLRQRKLPIYQIVNIATQIARGMEHAHSKNVIHRDLKPSNILISSDSGTVKVTDFGIAKLAEEHLSDRMLTQESVGMGTADYMSPEQRRDSRAIDGRTDVFSFGVLLYEMVTGRIPVGRFRDPQDLRDDTPPLLNQIILRCLQEDPDDRYPEFQDILRDLNRLTQRGVVYRELLGRMSESVSHMKKKTSKLSRHVADDGWRKFIKAAGTILLVSAALFTLTRILPDILDSDITTPEPGREPRQPSVADYSRVESLVAEERFEEALDELDSIRGLATEQGDRAEAAEALWRIAAIQEDRGNIHDAADSYASLVDTYGGSSAILDEKRLSEALFRAGMFSADDREYERALTYLGRLRTDYPSHPRSEEAHLREIILLDDHSDPPPGRKQENLLKTVEACRAFVDRFPGSAMREDILWRMSRAYVDMDNRTGYGKAVETLEEMAELFPRSVYLPLFEAAEISRTGLEDADRAGNLYRKFLDRRPGSDRAEEAREWIEKL